MMMIFFSRHKEYLLRGCLKSLHGFLQRYPHAMVIVDFRELRTIVTSSEAALHQLKTLMSGLFKQPLRAPPPLTGRGVPGAAVVRRGFSPLRPWYWNSSASGCL